MKPSLMASCGVLITAKDKVLLGFHIETQQWRMPGGWQEMPETMLQCAIREVKEETGLDVRYKLKGDTCWGEFGPALWIGYLAELKEIPEITNPEPNKFSEWRWFDLNKIPRPIFQPTEEILNYFTNQDFIDWKHFDA